MSGFLIPDFAKFEKFTLAIEEWHIKIIDNKCDQDIRDKEPHEHGSVIVNFGRG